MRKIHLAAAASFHARFRLTAVLLLPGHTLVFGGCSAGTYTRLSGCNRLVSIHAAVGVVSTHAAFPTLNPRPRCAQLIRVAGMLLCAIPCEPCSLHSLKLHTPVLHLALTHICRGCCVRFFVLLRRIVGGRGAMFTLDYLPAMLPTGVTLLGLFDAVLWVALRSHHPHTLR